MPAKNAPKLPGVDEQPSIPEITELGVVKRKLDKKLAKTRADIGDVNAELLVKFHEHKISRYVDEEVSPRLVLSLVGGKERIKVVDEEKDDDDVTEVTE